MGLLHDLKAAGITSLDALKKALGMADAPSVDTNIGKTGQVTMPPRGQCVRVKVVSNATGGGKYLGPILNSFEMAQVAETGNLAETELGGVPTVTNLYALILNAAEVGQSTHDLTAGTPVAKVFIGYLLPRRSTTDRLVVVISGYDWLACS